MCDDGRRKDGTQFLPSFLPTSFLHCRQAHSVVCDSKKIIEKMAEIEMRKMGEINFVYDGRNYKDERN